MDRVVLDTNVLVSAFTSPSGVPGQIFDMWQGNKFILVISHYILDELERILIKKIGLSEDFVLERTQQFTWLAQLVEPTEVFENLAEENDWPILGTAVAGQADYLVTGDRVLLNLKHYGGTPIVSPKQFLNEKS